MASLDGVWNVERVGGLLPPLYGVRKRIRGTRGETLFGPVPASFRVVGERELHYEPPLYGLVDLLEPEAGGFGGRATLFGRELGRFRMTRETRATTLEQQLVEHVDEAYAMEQNVRRMLDGLIETTDDPDVVRELERHRLQTETHADRMRRCLERRGARPSAPREAAGLLGALMKLPLDALRGQKAGRNARDAYATEHVEIAAYELLARIADRAGDEETAREARSILEEEREMARTIEQLWDRLAELSLREAGVPAP